jgi:tRNA(Ile)-lysidine synthase
MNASAESPSQESGGNSWFPSASLSSVGKALRSIPTRLVVVLWCVLARKVLDCIRQLDLLKPGDRVGLAVSGGSDSVALLRVFLELRSELGVVLSVVHFNHKLRGTESDDDEKFVTDLARRYDLELHVDSANVSGLAAEKRLSIETAARELRYEFFRKLMQPPDQGDADSGAQLDKIATGHTLDDQAETVLMRVIRGTGTRGLGGIFPVVELLDDYEEPFGQVVRPLLSVRRPELEQYLRERDQPWREDSSNRHLTFTRNRVRHLLLPLLEKEFNPSIIGGLAELADIARAEEDYWENEISGWMGTAIHWSEPEWARSEQSQGLVQLTPFKPELQKRLQEPGPLIMNATMDLAWLLSEPLAVQRRAVKSVGDVARLPLEFKHIEEILAFASEDKNSGKELSLPLGWKLLREPHALTFLTPDLRTQERVPSGYEYPLPLPGRAIVPEAGIVVEAMRVPSGVGSHTASADQLLNPFLVSKDLLVRNWRPGDRYWPVHTKEPKKIKELLQHRHITGPERKLWPVVASGDDIVWVRGFPGPASFLSKEGSGEAVLIREVPLED